MLCGLSCFVGRSGLGYSVDVLKGVAIGSNGHDLLLFGSLVRLMTDHFGSVCEDGNDGSLMTQ
jgi:hypothetical protein